MIDDEELMAICAIRYCIGRQSYIVSAGMKWAMRYGTSSPEVRKIIIEDLETATNHGSAEDKIGWMAVLDLLKRVP